MKIPEFCSENPQIFVFFILNDIDPDGLCGEEWTTYIHNTVTYMPTLIRGQYRLWLLLPSSRTSSYNTVYLDRYYAISRPLRYIPFRTHRLIWISIFAIQVENAIFSQKVFPEISWHVNLKDSKIHCLRFFQQKRSIPFRSDCWEYGAIKSR